MIMLEKIASPILGGLIGYFTNWLAIKMLFLPRTPKHIGKFKLPFTPGLIPKEKANIAKKIANVCEENILNQDTLKENVFTIENKEKVYLLLENKLSNLKDKDYELKDILVKINQLDLIDKLENKCLVTIESYLDSDKHQEEIASYVTEHIVNFIREIDKYEDLKENIKGVILDILCSEDFKSKILGKKVNEIISSDNIDKIKYTVFDSTPKVCNFIVDKLQDNNELDTKLKGIVKDIIEKNLGGIAGFFLNYDKIYASIKRNVILNMRDKENQNKIGIKIFEYITTYQTKELFEIYEMLPSELKVIIEEKTSKDNIDKLLDTMLFDKYFNGDTLYNIIDSNINNFEQKISMYIKGILSKSLKVKVLAIVKNLIDKNKEKLLSFKLNILLNRVTLNDYKDTIFNYIENFIEKDGDKLLSEIHIGDMVENKINSFDVETIENITLSVAKKELNAITIMGGILGFVIGLVPLLYS